jgi:hypothetical protein
MQTKKKDWYRFQQYIAGILNEIDPSANSTKASGGSTVKGDVTNSVGLHIEAKQRNTKSVTIDYKVWQKTCEEIPLHVDRIPLLALENKDKKRWAVLDLDDFLEIWIELHKYREGEL